MDGARWTMDDERLIDGQKYNGEKKSVCLSAEGGQEVFGNPQIDRIIPRQSCAIFRVAGHAPFSLKTWNRESVGEGRGGEARGVGERVEVEEEHG